MSTGATCGVSFLSRRRRCILCLIVVVGARLRGIVFGVFAVNEWIAGVIDIKSDNIINRMHIVGEKKELDRTFDLWFFGQYFVAVWLPLGDTDT